MPLLTELESNFVAQLQRYRPAGAAATRPEHRPATRQHGGRPQGLTKGPSDVLDHATSEIASGSKLGIDATKKLPGEGFKRPWPPLIRMDENVRKKIDALFRESSR